MSKIPNGQATELKTCVFCGRFLCSLASRNGKHYIRLDEGNNPSPVKERGRCCDKCNLEVVIPHRIRLLNRLSKVERSGDEGV